MVRDILIVAVFDMLCKKGLHLWSRWESPKEWINYSTVERFYTQNRHCIFCGKEDQRRYS